MAVHLLWLPLCDHPHDRADKHSLFLSSSVHSTLPLPSDQSIPTRSSRKTVSTVENTLRCRLRPLCQSNCNLPRRHRSRHCRSDLQQHLYRISISPAQLTSRSIERNSTRGQI